MIRRVLLLVASVVLVFLFRSDVRAADWYVDASVAGSGDGTSAATAFKTIHEGIAAASAADTVIVLPGTYQENVDFLGKSIILRSTDPTDRGVVDATTIDGNQAGAAVTFSGDEDATCLLSGFTIRNGEAAGGGGVCGGTTENHTLATIENNVIVDNAAQFGGGGGLAYCDGPIRRNLITGNSGGFVGGGGLSDCDGPIVNNIIADNIGGLSGGGLYGCDGPIENNTIVDNAGGGLDAAGGLESCTGTIRNCIIWGNLGDWQIARCTPPTYSCIQNWRDAGEGNTDYFPYFLDAENRDYHLMTYSPSIDSGDPASPFAEEPAPNGGRINRGGYGNTSEATPGSPDTDDDDLPDDWEMKFFGNLAQKAEDDPNGNLVTNLEEYRRGLNPGVEFWYVDDSVVDSGDGKSWATAFKTIQEGIYIAKDGDIVTVAEGDYKEDIYFMGKNITVTGTNPLDPASVEGTKILGDQIGPVVNFDGSENPACVLSGFTISNGKMERGGGIAGEHTHATIENNVISGNSADHGGGIADCSGLIQNNTIVGNHAVYHGGGLVGCGGLILNNRIADNTADTNGGGLGFCNGTIRNNTIHGNVASLIGGLMYCSGTIENNLIADNDGGGLGNCDGLIRNNRIVGNTSWFAGAFELCNGTIVNNTIVANHGSEAGAIHSSAAVIRNCIIWGNTDPQIVNSSLPTYSCLSNWTGGGEGNISLDPRFIDPSGPDDDINTFEDNDYHLAPPSPCIDAGLNENWMWTGIDSDGNPRIFYGKTSKTVDMGAYEYESWPFRVVEMTALQGGQARLTWISRPADSYTIWSSSDLTGIQWNEEETISSQGTSTTWTDPGPVVPPTYYRIEQK